MIGTKIRALYQRNKGRDLFDLAVEPLNIPEWHLMPPMSTVTEPHLKLSH